MSTDDKNRKLFTGESVETGRNRYRYFDLAGKRRSVYTDSLQELRAEEDRIKKELNAGISTDHTILNDQIVTYLKTRTNLKMSTLDNYKFYFHHCIENSPLGQMKIRDVRKTHILLFYSNMSKEGMANGTIHVLHKIICPALQLAADEDRIFKNPSKGCLKDYPVPSEMKYALTRDEEQELLTRLKLCPSVHHRIDDLIRFILLTGLRISEAIGLTWDDVDFEGRTFSVNHQVEYRTHGNSAIWYSEDTTKTDSGNRIIPMTDEVYDILMKFHMKAQKRDIKTVTIGNYTNFIFTSEATGYRQPFSANSVRRKLHNVVVMNDVREVQLPAISPHILRHTYCTRIAAQGVPIKTAMYLAGHSDVRTAIKTYQHINLEDVRDQMKKIDNGEDEGEMAQEG